MKNPILFPIIPILIAFTLLSCDNDDDRNLTPQPQTISTATELTDALNEIYLEGDAPGFAVSVVKNNAILFQQSFGKEDIAANKDYTNQTTQPIGSISKTFVAAAIVHAIEAGYFTLETNINDILPVKVINPNQPDAIIQVKHLVTHTSGLLDNYEAYFQAYHILPEADISTAGAQIMLNGFGAQPRESVPLEEFLAAYYLDDGDLFSLENFANTAPGSTWSYSNIATSLAAYLVEAATGTPFKQYVTTNIFQPLGMLRTSYDAVNLHPNQTATLYWDKNTPLPIYNNDSYPDAGVMTCNEDLTKYLMDMMKGAQGTSTTLFSKTGYDLLFNALLSNGKVPSALGENQGIFWFLGNGYIRHDGSDPGTTCNLQFDENGESGYFLMTNMDASTTEHEAAYFDLAAKIHKLVTEFTQNN